MFRFDIKFYAMAKGDVLVRAIPDDILNVVLRRRDKEKQKKGIKQFSLSTTIIKIIKEWNNKCNESL